MSGSIYGSTCATHLGEVAVANCAYCGKPVCDTCSTQFLATEQTFCSERCRDAVPQESGNEAASNETLEIGLDTPIRTGWLLWLRSLGRIGLYALPFAAVIGLAGGYTDRVMEDLTIPPIERPAFVALTLLIAFVASFGLALISVLLSARYTGVVNQTPVRTATRRYIPWAMTWILMLGITFAGYFAFLIPGIYLSLRLFWADEFALIHNKGPFEALKASWNLTRGQTGRIFVFQFVLGFAQYALFIPTLIVGGMLLLFLTALGLAGPEKFPGASIGVFSFLGLVFYGSMHAPEIVQFYGMRAARARAETGMAPIARQRSQRGVVVLALVLFGIPVIAALAIPNLINAIDKAKQKSTLAYTKVFASVIELYSVDNDHYPRATSVADLEPLSFPDDPFVLPVNDGWGRPFQVISAATDCEIRSAGKDGVFETSPPRGATSNFDDDIVWRNGELVQWPEDFPPE